MLILLTCTYLATINLKYTSYNNHEEAGIRFTGACFEIIVYRKIKRQSGISKKREECG